MLTGNSSNNTDINTNIQSLYEIEYEQFLNKNIVSAVVVDFVSFYSNGGQ
jgi:hypothetical protein